MAAERLTAEDAIRVQHPGRQLHHVVDGGHVVGGHADLDHLQVLGRFEHAVPDLRGLDHAVPGLQHEGRALVLVHELHLAPVGEDQLETHGVVVHDVRHGTGVGNPDVGGDDAPAEASGHQVAVVHAGAADHPGRVVLEAPHEKGMLRRRYFERRFGQRDLDPGAVRRGEFGLAARQGRRIATEDPERAGRFRRALLEADGESVSGEHGDRRVVGGVDLVHAESQGLHEEGQVRGQVRARQPDLGALDVVLAVGLLVVMQLHIACSLSP